MYMCLNRKHYKFHNLPYILHSYTNEVNSIFGIYFNLGLFTCVKIIIKYSIVNFIEIAIIVCNSKFCQGKILTNLLNQFKEFINIFFIKILLLSITDDCMKCIITVTVHHHTSSLFKRLEKLHNLVVTTTE